MSDKIEYPKMIYRGEGLTDYIVVKDIEEHLLKELEGYHQHDGTLIGVKSSNEEETKEVEDEKIAEQEEIAENTPEDKPDEEAKHDFKCPHCKFIGKNAQSLVMHKNVMHKGK